MFRRRRRDDEAPHQEQPHQSGEHDADQEQPADEGAAEAAGVDRTSGPYDSSEVDLDQAREGRIDLGGLLIRGVDGMKIQLQVDKRSGRGTSALLAVGEAAVQLVAVAAPRSSGLWEQTRLQIAEDAKRRGGSAQEGTGPFGTEVRVVIPVTTKDGKQGHQPSRISGIDGPRWMLRATFLGKAISDASAFQRLVEVTRQVVVVRGDTPMPPGEVISLTPPSRETPETDQDEVPTITDSQASEVEPTEQDT
ncbi:DUF3710 domain-containing protein [Phytoactinopolyspora mesophila]|uniref:DUF3710 domain-containing protein n=1 Tax=Phytoactinopolyspora mesophila TaxID=2650750 RepID=A0A7K3LY40_9ACTN|nr:DUF3710 domain-containing protein [Phytoactinopolyspora mesophila]